MIALGNSLVTQWTDDRCQSKIFAKIPSGREWPQAKNAEGHPYQLKPLKSLDSEDDTLRDLPIALSQLR